MKVFLVGLGLALLCVVNVQSKCSDDMKEVEGKWYGTALANDSKHFLDHKDRIKIVAIDLSITEDDNLKLSANMPNHRKEGCQHMEKEFTKLGNGTYFHASEQDDEKMDFIYTDCTTYVILLMQKIKENGVSKFMAIHTKEPEMSLDLKEKFLEYALNMGFKEDQMMFPSEVACENEA